MGQKLRAVSPFLGGNWVPIKHNVAWADFNNSSQTELVIWRVHGLVTAVYTYACVHRSVHGRERAVYTAVYGPCQTV